MGVCIGGPGPSAHRWSPACIIRLCCSMSRVSSAPMTHPTSRHARELRGAGDGGGGRGDAYGHSDGDSGDGEAEADPPGGVAMAMAAARAAAACARGVDSDSNQFESIRFGWSPILRLSDGDTMRRPFIRHSFDSDNTAMTESDSSSSSSMRPISPVFPSLPGRAVCTPTHMLPRRVGGGGSGQQWAAHQCSDG